MFATAAGIAGAQTDARLINLSVLAKLNRGETLITGVVVRGDQPARLLVRGVGPTLATFGIPNALPDPALTIFDGRGAIVVANPPSVNPPPVNTPPVVSLDPVTVVSPFPVLPLDVSRFVDVSPGPYSLAVGGGAGSEGVVLAEIYDTRNDADVGTTKLVNLSARGAVGNGVPFIGGFVIRGTATKRYLLRAPGPSLAAFGVPRAAPDTVIELFNEAGTAIRSNDNWESGTAAETLELRQAMLRAGAFTFPAGSRDAAMVVALPPGLYSMSAREVNGISGVALIEIYALDD